LTGTNLGMYLIQAANYSNYEFKTKFIQVPIKILIFISPAISNVIREIKLESKIMVNDKEYFELYHDFNLTVNNVNSFIGCFNVGEIRSFKGNLPKYNYFYFLYKNQIIWDSLNGIRLHNYNKVYDLVINKLSK